MGLVTTQLSYDMPSNYTKLDVHDKIAQYDADATPLLKLTTQLNKKAARNTTIRWWEDDLVQRWALVGSTAAANTTTVVAITMASTTDAQYCDPGGAKGAVLYNPQSGEQMLCTSVSGDDITVTRAYSDAATLSTVTAATALLRIGTIDQENELSHTPLILQPAEKTNFTEIFRDPITFSGSQLAEMHYIGDNRKLKLQQLGRQHAVDIEQTMFLGLKKAGASTTARAMGGIKEYMSTTNQTSLSATALTESAFESWMFSVFRHTPNGGRNLFVFGGGKLMQALNNIGRTALQTVSGSDNPYGIRFTRWISAQGDVRLVRHWLMHRSPTSTVDYTLERLAYAINMDLVQYRPLAGRDTALRMNIQENDRDGEKHEYLTEASLMFQLPKAHGTLVDVGADFI